jgi:hypothetical protein
MSTRVCQVALFFFIGMAALLLPAEDGRAQGCRLTLTNGSVITAPVCYEENGIVYITKLGATVGMHRSDVARFEKIATEETPDTMALAPAAPATPAAQQASPTEREARLRELRGMTKADRKAQKQAEKEAAKVAKAARDEEERPYKEFKSYEESLKSARTNEKISCGQASEPLRPSSGPISGEQAGATIKARHDASEGCKYYRTQIPKMEKKLEELRIACGSKCR